MKKRGILACLLLAISFVGGLAFGKSEFFVTTAIMGVLLLVALVQAATQRPYFVLDTGSGQVVRENTKTITLSARNPFFWPLLPVRLTVSLQQQGQTLSTLAYWETALAPRQEKTLQIDVTCPHRGEYQVLLQRYYAEDIFGFFALPGEKLPPQTLLSLPKLGLITLNEQDMEKLDDENNRESHKGQPGQATAESRPYQSGDSMRFIHWKKSASRHQLFTRLREPVADYSCCLLMDTTPIGLGEEQLAYEDLLCETALNFLFLQLSQQQPITMLPGELTLQAPESVSKAAAMLAMQAFDEETTFLSLQALLNSPQLPDMLFLLLAQPPTRLNELLEQLADCNCMISYLCPANRAAELEQHLPVISIGAPAEISGWLEV